MTISHADSGRGGATRELLPVHSRRRYWLARGAGAILFALVCGSAMREGGGLAILLGGVGMLMFGSFAAYALRQLLRREPRLMLSQEGFIAADLDIGLVPWRDVAEVQGFGSPRAPFIAFLVPDATGYLERMPWYPRAIVRLLSGSGLPMFSVNLIGVDRSVWDIARQAEALRAAARSD
jgi:hypothetical protein